MPYTSLYTDVALFFFLITKYWRVCESEPEVQQRGWNARKKNKERLQEMSLGKRGLLSPSPCQHLITSAFEVPIKLNQWVLISMDITCIMESYHTSNIQIFFGVAACCGYFWINGLKNTVNTNVIFLFSGGLTAVIYTDTLCTFLMVVGSLTVMGIGNGFVSFCFAIKWNRNPSINFLHTLLKSAMH